MCNDNPLIVELGLPGGETVPGSLLDLTIDGAGILMPRVLVPHLVEGHSVLFSVEHSSHEWLVQTQAQVVRLFPQGPHEVLVGLCFENSGNLYAQLDDAMGRYFNRRKDGRVLAPESDSLAVHISNGATKCLGRIYDLSHEGVGLALPYMQGLELQPGGDLGVRFKLPGSRKEMAGMVQVRQRHVLGGVAYVGAILGPDFEPHKNRIAKFIARCQLDAAKFLWIDGDEAPDGDCEAA